MLNPENDRAVAGPDARGRELERFSEEVARDLGLERASVGPVRAALQTLRRLPVVWFQFAPATRASDAFARCTAPWAGDLLYARLPDSTSRDRTPDPSVLARLTDALRGSAGRYLCVIEGPIPLATPSLSRIVHTALQVCSSARAVLCVGAAGAGIAAAKVPAVLDALGSPAVHIAGAPPTAAALAAAIVTKLAGSALRETQAAVAPKPVLQLVR